MMNYQPTNDKCYFTSKRPLLPEGRKIVFQDGKSAIKQVLQKTESLLTKKRPRIGPKPIANSEIGVIRK